MGAPRPVSLKVRALQWLAQREHSPQDLRARLIAIAARRPEDAADEGDAAAAREVDALIDWLGARGYLSPQRFVEGRIRARQARYGNRRIEQELRQHGLALDADAQRALRETEFERAREVWRRKYGVLATDAAARVRQMRFLVGRGFSPEVVRRIVRDGGDSGAA
jgi:regulatory protein